MSGNEFNWGDGLFGDPSGNSEKKRKKELENPLGFSVKPSGIIDDVDNILRQGSETDRAIGEASSQLKKTEPAVRIVETPVIQPESKPVSGIDPNTGKTEQTDKGANDGNRFRYRTKAYNTGNINEMEKRASDYEESLKIDSGNEGYTLPPVQPSKGRESYPDENRKLQENAANEGFTIRNSEEYRQAQIESEQNMKSMTEFFGKFLRGNERENRFANGLPAEGEGHSSILGNYLDLKNKTDNFTQEDWEKGIKNLSRSSFGQGVMDIHHSGAASGYDLAEKALILSHMLDSTRSLHAGVYENGIGWTDPDTRVRYSVSPSDLNDYRTWKFLKKAGQAHKDARSDDFKQDWKTNHGYIPIKAVGTGIQDILTPLVTAYLATQTGQVGEMAVPLLSGVVGGYSKGYAQRMEEKENIPEVEMMKNPVYVKMRRHGWSDEYARFALSRQEAEAEGWMQGLYGLVSSYLTGKAVGMTRTGDEGELMKTGQDIFFDKLIDYLK